MKPIVLALLAAVAIWGAFALAPTLACAVGHCVPTYCHTNGPGCAGGCACQWRGPLHGVCG